MQQITISGTLVSNSESCTDKNGKSFSRFSVVCGSREITGRTKYTYYRCICYVSGYERLKKGDQVFVTGKLNADVAVDSKGQPYLQLNVMVYQASGGFRADERKRV